MLASMNSKSVVVFLCCLSALVLLMIYIFTTAPSLLNTSQDAEEETRGHQHLAVGTAPRNISSPRQLNPGCLERKLRKYRALDTGMVYHHPSIVHYAKLNSGPVDINFREYTSVLSVRKFMKPERIIFHTYTDIVGKYWDMIRGWEDVRIELNKISPVHYIGGKYVPYVQHEADYVKLKAVYRHGGTALDFDAVIVNATRLRREQRLSECVLSEEGEYINGGFYSCIRESPFIEKWLESYDKDYRPDLWLHNVSFRPRDLLVDPHSKVCYNVHLDDTICIHPNWGKQREWLGNRVEWRTKTVAHYFVKEGIHNDGEGLLKENHSLGKLLQYVHGN